MFSSSGTDFSNQMIVLVMTDHIAVSGLFNVSTPVHDGKCAVQSTPKLDFPVSGTGEEIGLGGFAGCLLAFPKKHDAMF